MRIFSSIMILLVIKVVDSSNAIQCSSDESTSHFSFAVSSRRNSSGHRIVLVDVQSHAHRSSDPDEDIALGVTHRRTVCGNMETVQLNTVTSVPELHLKVRKDYELFPGLGYYKLHTTGKTWDDARIACTNEQAHLLVINSEPESNVVKVFFSQNPVFQNVSSQLYVLIGFHDKIFEGHFAVVTGELLSRSGYTRWAPNQPDGGTRENVGGADREAQLHDIMNSEKFGFICEMEL